MHNHFYGERVNKRIQALFQEKALNALIVMRSNATKAVTEYYNITLLIIFIFVLWLVKR